MHKIAGNEASTISRLSPSHNRIILCCPVDKSCMQFIPHSVVYMYLTIAKIYLDFITFIAVQIHEILSVDLAALKLFSVPLYSEFLSDLHKKFQEASTYNINLECQIWRFFCNLCLSYAYNRYTYKHANQKLKKEFFYSGDLKTCKSIKISTSKNSPKNNTSSTYR